MATEAANPPPPPTAEVVGNAFVDQYYHILHHSPELVHRFYQDVSVLSRPDPSGLMTTVTTMKSINETICSLDYKKYKAEIKTADAQDSYEDGVVVQVTGCLTGPDNLKKKFTQTFFLAPQDKGYYVLNDILRYVEESEPEISMETVTGVQLTPSRSATQDPEPAQVVGSPKVDHETSQVEEAEIFEAKSSDLVIEEREAGDNHTDTLIEADSHVNGNHVTEVADAGTSSSQEETPKKSYASIVSSQTKKGPTKIYVPTTTAKLAQPKAEQPINTDTKESRRESTSDIRPDDVPENKDVQDEVQGHSIYIRNLPLHFTVTQLQAEFQKFGTIKPNGVQVRNNWVGFSATCFSILFNLLNFESPMTIGDRQATVEIKRTTTRVGGGRGRFASSRGGFRNENFRGRGNFSSGRVYGRNGDLRGRGNFNGGLSGEGGYQQGRERGYRRSSPNQNSSST
ncbi:Nuclear transport factor 2 (NTF2) family protein with RNA binding (RRM-RBD-RNP motifs) domain [Striga hermonthica]|uniref:Nuclear transport factor 2 (NTF2) family protein with RNA binding (RRM-RBD-RNP motifs) domain n=1 Tax=Striga hermonthica TaxID=68872 RepID=A0A9N7RHQ7_STRHE|nr:Nuclear transport factor 2 (NTF2) family protein with RNA binding (RRM-RBD-RNP motifs) domain [Striga hermonthica]